tara:strand:- start:2079 stop:2231 length:153 start_codon:yes stop_codon:yes gene_type:complete
MRKWIGEKDGKLIVIKMTEKEFNECVWPNNDRFIMPPKMPGEKLPILAWV